MKELRTNVLALTAMAVVLCCVLGLWLDTSDLAMLGAGIIGAIGATMTKLVDPPTPPQEPTVPASTADRMLDVLEKFAQRNV